MRRFFYAIFFLATFPHPAFAAESVRLPYAAGERFIVTTGYDTPPMHIKKDSYAIDFTQDGCGAYGKPAVAVLSGTAWVAEENGYNGGYGTQLLILTSGGMVMRYAHLIPGSIPINQGDTILQGTIVGEIGDTGLVMGTACAEHPGTHIHFAMDTKNSDGSFAAKDPEPISGYSGITAGKWYVSDNVIAPTRINLATLLEILSGLLGGSVMVANSPSSTATPSPDAALPSVSEPQPAQNGIPASVSMPVLIAPISSSSFPAAILLQASSSRNVLNASSTSVFGVTSSAPNVPSGGGAGPVGGVSVSIPEEPQAPPAAVTSSVLPGDPTDDSVSACE